MLNPLALFAGPYGLMAKWGVIALLLASFGAWSYTKGVDRESDRRDAIELKQVALEHEGHAMAVAFGVAQAKKAQANQAAAENYQQKWKEARDASKRSGTPLATCDADPAPAGEVASAPGLKVPAPAPGVRLRLTWAFVRLWDSVYTDSAGQPIFSDSARAESGSAGPGAASPYSADDLLDRHGENAKRWDACRRQLRALNATIDRLERDWNVTHAH